MSAIGTITEIVNNENLLLKLGGDTFMLMQDCRFNLDRPISRQTTSGGGVVYFFGSGDNSIDFTLLLSTPEMEDSGATGLIGLTERNANGKLTDMAITIVATNVSGASKTITATGVIPHLEIQRLAGVGGIVFNGRIQLTGDSVTVA
jgi:hypothetical protein